MANRLASATSPYLRQHADNPVDWHEWSPSAFAEARERNVPILLSVGYAACHWCHVMAHESFEDADVAEALNAGFVSIKVDREERPDVDSVYMQATTAMTGAGGWPMTCLLTPQGEPFWCGTYLPKPGFLRLLTTVADAWATREDEIRAGGAHVVATLAEATAAETVAAPLGPDELEAAVAELARSYDHENGGFGTSPKFPPSMVLQFLARHAARTGSVPALQMLTGTAEAMARGGMYDQLDGGFARYAVDRAWVVPHFEKMLYDNAQLLRGYTAAAVVAGGVHRPLFEQVVRQTAEFLLRDLRTPEGTFTSSLDADTEGVEGATYVWTPEQLQEVLGPHDGARAAALLSVTTDGTFEHGASTLQLRTDPDDQQWWEQIRARLARARAQRPQPARDDKVVTSWNGLAIAALAEAGWRFDEPEWIEAATTAATVLRDRHLVNGRLRRSSLGDRVATAAAVADDYGNLAEAWVVLHLVTADNQWLSAAGELLSVAVDSFALDAHDSGRMRFADTATPTGPDGESSGQGGSSDALPWRPRSRGDNAEPCGQSALASALLLYGAAAGSADHLRQGVAALAEMAAVATTDPRFAGWALAAAEGAVAGPVQVAISPGTGAGDLVAAARRATPPGALAITGTDQTTAPLLQGRGPVNGKAAAYVCRGTVCSLPLTDAGSLTEELRPAP